MACRRVLKIGEGIVKDFTGKLLFFAENFIFFRGSQLKLTVHHSSNTWFMASGAVGQNLCGDEAQHTGW